MQRLELQVSLEPVGISNWSAGTCPLPYSVDPIPFHSHWPEGLWVAWVCHWSPFFLPRSLSITKLLFQVCFPERGKPLCVSMETGV